MSRTKVKQALKALAQDSNNATALAYLGQYGRTVSEVEAKLKAKVELLPMEFEAADKSRDPRPSILTRALGLAAIPCDFTNNVVMLTKGRPRKLPTERVGQWSKHRPSHFKTCPL